MKILCCRLSIVCSLFNLNAVSEVECTTAFMSLVFIILTVVLEKASVLLSYAIFTNFLSYMETQ
jgi:hypothetical protein